jgi:hypothetical protein
MIFKKIMILFIISILFIGIINNIHALRIMEPIIEDLTYKSVVDIGLTSPGEQILVSFYQGANSQYYEIKLSNESKEIAFIENTRQTKESIYTTINIKENIRGSKNIELYLVGLTERKITLRTTITNEVVYAYIPSFEKQTKINTIKKIPITIINNATSTKEIIVSSDIDKHSFSKDLITTKKILLQPKSVTNINYEYIPKTVGEKTQNIYLFLNTLQKTQIIEENTKEIIVLDFNVETIKNLKSIQDTKKQVFTLYGLNILPVHFFNNFIGYLFN